jgi:hypothetical protein
MDSKQLAEIRHRTIAPLGPNTPVARQDILALLAMIDGGLTLPKAVDEFMMYAQLCFLWPKDPPSEGEMNAYRARYWVVKNLLGVIKAGNTRPETRDTVIEEIAAKIEKMDFLPDGDFTKSGPEILAAEIRTMLAPSVCQDNRPAEEIVGANSRP